jgi:hypothetical protein
METFEPSREQERVEHLQHLLKRATQEALPIELETKVLNIDVEAITAALRKNAARELDGEHLLVDRRYKRVKEVKKIPDSFQLALSAIKDTDQNSIHFFQALIKMGLDITQVGVSHIAAKPRNDYWTKAGVDVRLREIKTCQNKDKSKYCMGDFEITPDDFTFYEKIKVLPPTFCQITILFMIIFHIFTK